MPALLLLVGLLYSGRHLGQQGVDVCRWPGEGDVDFVAGIVALAVVDLGAQVEDWLVDHQANIGLDDGHAALADEQVDGAGGGRWRPKGWSGQGWDLTTDLAVFSRVRLIQGRPDSSA
jgi:hypothetical protein